MARRSGFRSVCCVATLIGIPGAPRVASSANPSARLVYVRGEGATSCPDEQALHDAVRARFGYDPFFAWAKRTVLVQVWQDGDALRSRIQIVDGRGVVRGTRQLTDAGADCAHLFATTALTISIALDAFPVEDPPSAEDPAQAPAQVAPPAPPPRPSPPPPAPAPPSSPEQPSPPTQPTESEATSSRNTRALLPFMGIDVSSAEGVAPAVAFGGGVAGGLRIEPYSLALELSAYAPTTQTLADGTHLSSWSLLGAVVPCWHWHVASFCAVGKLGSLNARSPDVSSHPSGATLMGEVGVRAGIEVPLSSHLAVRAQGELLANIPRTTVYFGSDPAWPEPIAVGTLGAGWVAYFP